MPNVFFTADAHLGHRNISAFRPYVKDDEDNTKQFCEEWSQKINQKTAHRKKDVIWCLGDMAFNAQSTEIIAALRGRKFLALGNHDYLHPSALVNTYEKLLGIVSHYGFWLSHAPIHPAELYSRKNIHGHVHEKTLPNENYVNISQDALMLNFGCRIIDINQLRDYIEMGCQGKVKIAEPKDYSYKGARTSK